MNRQWRFWVSWSIGLALLFALGVYAVLQWNLNNYSRLVADRLLLLGELRRGAVQEYFATADAELRFWSTNQSMLDAQADLLAIWREDPQLRDRVRRAYVEENPHPEGFRLNLDDAGDASAYSEFHARMHASARLFVTERGYYDFFLISPDGDVLYTVEKEADFAANLVNGPFRETGLAKAFEKVRRNAREGLVVLTDMEPYEPSDGEPAIFMATALSDQAGTFIGVIAFQLPTDGILGIMNYTSGMGETGETYLVGQDRLMRSDSRFTDESTVLTQVVDTPTVARALAGEQGVDFVRDYRDVEVMSVYLPMELGETRWAVMAEIDSAEIEEGAARERPSMAGALLFLYSLGLWSVWYWRGRTMPESADHYASLDFGDTDGGGLDG
jgi:methyl-accepting chemotaxis protein